MLNLWAGWIGILLGMVTGAGFGLVFHDAEWLGGYQSWRRRLLRLGHISLFGLAFINLAFFLTVNRVGASDAGSSSAVVVASYLLAAGALFMPLVCFLSAWRPVLRSLFFLPVGCLIAGLMSLLIGGLPWVVPL